MRKLLVAAAAMAALGAPAHAEVNAPPDFDRFEWSYVCESVFFAPGGGHYHASVLIRDGRFYWSEDGKMNVMVPTNVLARHGGIDRFGHYDRTQMELSLIGRNGRPSLYLSSSPQLVATRGSYDCLAEDDPALDAYADSAPLSTPPLSTPKSLGAAGCDISRPFCPEPKPPTPAQTFSCTTYDDCLRKIQPKPGG
jgi:hypothetical protein